jgi:hypothetical protein
MVDNIYAVKQRIATAPATNTEYSAEYKKVASILDVYLKDILKDIKREIDTISEWQTKTASAVLKKKNPRLLSKYINSDNNINIIRAEINKLAPSNFALIHETIINILNTTDSAENVQLYIGTIFSVLAAKMYSEETNIALYIHFITTLAQYDKYTGILSLFTNLISDICMFCQTPSQSSAPASAPASASASTNYSSYGRILGEWHKHTGNADLITAVHNNLRALSGALTGEYADKQVALLIGFAQTPELQISPLVQSLYADMHALLESKLAYKYKFRLMEFCDSLKPSISSHQMPAKSIPSASPPPLPPPPHALAQVLDPGPIAMKITLYRRLITILKKNAALLIEPSIIKKVDAYIADNPEYCDEMYDIVVLFVDKLHASPNDMDYIVEFMAGMHESHNNIWAPALHTFINELVTFNAAHNWQTIGAFIGHLVDKGILGIGDMEHIVMYNKKNSGKIVEIKYRILHGVNMALGVKRISILLTSSQLVRYVANMRQLEIKMMAASNANLVAVNADYIDKIEKIVHKQQTNRFDMLRDVML